MGKLSTSRADFIDLRDINLFLKLVGPFELEKSVKI